MVYMARIECVYCVIFREKQLLDDRCKNTQMLQLLTHKSAHIP